MSFDRADFTEIQKIREAIEKRNELLEKQNEILSSIDDKLFKIYAGLP